MQASWGPSSTVQMSQECAELGTTSLLPSPPPNPSSPHMLAQALPSPHPLPLSTFFHLSLCPLSFWYLATVQLPLRLLKGSLKAGTLPLLQTP